MQPDATMPLLTTPHGDCPEQKNCITAWRNNLDIGMPVIAEKERTESICSSGKFSK